MDGLTPGRAGAPWAPGVLLLAAAVAATGILGFALGLRGWAWYAGLFALVVLVIGLLERLWEGRPAPEPPAPRRRPSTRAGRGDYDLEQDDRTDSQRWLM